MSRAEMIQEYIDDLNEIADFREGEPELSVRKATECFGVIHVICLSRLKELDELKIKIMTTGSDKMTEAAKDILAWVAIGIIAFVEFACVIWGFRLPKKGSGWGRII